MSASVALTSLNPWSTPKDPHHLKRRHTRGHTKPFRCSPSPPTSPSSASFSESSLSQCSTQEEDLGNVESTASIHRSFSANVEKGTDDIVKKSPSTGVPSWFGSLRSFAISASSSSRGAFTPLIPSSAKSCPPVSTRPRSHGRSSSIYYAGPLDDLDSDSDFVNDYNQDEPITSKNGLKENRVRGPRMSWTMLDPSLGGILPTSYKSISGSEPELSSPSGSSLASSFHSNVEDLAITEAPYRDNDEEHDIVFNAADNEDLSWINDHRAQETDFDNTNASSAYPTVSTSKPAMALSFLKSCASSIPNFREGSDQGKNASSTPGPSGSGTWSFRRLSMNLLSTNQYVSLDVPEDPAPKNAQEGLGRDDSGQNCRNSDDICQSGHSSIPSPVLSTSSRSLMKMGRAD
ncbi:hypothetical protein BG011_000392 [Mortierella polycephala]|uniref:Uncharacterized protein n=1 Tax=Mortierella polycephala TaxID=41804 RepID=A0A9P6Q839_9FUNG|nr:hypothetical protein BG011_000392 [Mortierella polycephala]